MSKPTLNGGGSVVRQRDAFVQDEDQISGEVEIDWLPGGFFLSQHAQLDFAGLYKVDALELIGYDPVSDTFKSLAYSNMSPEPLPYEWDVREGTMTIRVSHGPLDATFQGRVSDDGRSYTGSWLSPPGGRRDGQSALRPHRHQDRLRRRRDEVLRIVRAARTQTSREYSRV